MAAVLLLFIVYVAMQLILRTHTTVSVPVWLDMGGTSTRFRSST